MADKVTQKDGSWSDTTVWNGGSLPASGQTVQISHNIIFDVDQSGFAAGLGAMSIDAGKSITASTSAGNYYMKMAGNITGGAGSEIRAGDAVNAYPSNCTFTIYINGNYSIDGGASNTLTCKFYCYDPPVKYLRLISAAPKAITGISKAATCTVTCVGHGYSGGDTIYLVNVGGMVELNNLRVKVKTVLGADSFTIRAYDADVVIDSTAFTTYTSGGYACPETAEAVGQTQLEVDQNVSADAEWTRSGATVNIDNVNRSNSSETRTISSAVSGSVTVSAGLTAAKHSSSLVILTSRNVMVQSSATNIPNGVIYRGSGHVLNCAIRYAHASTPAVYSTTNTSCSGVISGITAVYGRAFHTCTNVTFTGVLSTSDVYISSGTFGGIISGSTAAFNACSNFTSSATMSGCGYFLYNCIGGIFSGDAVGADFPVRGCASTVITGRIMNSNNGIYMSHVKLFGAVIQGNPRDLNDSTAVSTNSIFGSSVENYNYAARNQSQITESFDHDKVAGAFRCWTAGGICSSTTSNPPTSQVRSFNHVCESATYPCWRRWQIWVEPGRTLRLRVWLKADAGVEIKAQLVLPTADPLITGSGTGEWQQIGTSDTAWHEYITAWTNSATYPVLIEARALATAASGNGYSQIQYAFDRSPLRR